MKRTIRAAGTALASLLLVAGAAFATYRATAPLAPPRPLDARGVSSETQPAGTPEPTAAPEATGTPEPTGTPEATESPKAGGAQGDEDGQGQDEQGDGEHHSAAPTQTHDVSGDQQGSGGGGGD